MTSLVRPRHSAAGTAEIGYRRELQMEIPQDQAAQCERRCTIGPAIHGQEVVIAAATSMAGGVGLGSQRTTLLPLPVQEPNQGAERTLEVSSSAPEHGYQAPDEEESTSDPIRETQQLFFWSAAPCLLGISSAADRTGEGGETPPAASPSDALLHSLGDGGLRSAMRPPAFLPQHDWLRHLLLQAIEDAQLLFSSMWDECTCSSLRLPSKTCRDYQSADALDPVIAFAACAPSAPKRRLSGRVNAVPLEADEVNSVSVGSQRDLPEEDEGGQGVEAHDRAAEEVDTNKDGTQAPAAPTAREYISAVMSWATRQLDDPHLFPPSPRSAHLVDPGSRIDNSDDALVPIASLIVRRLLRCYAHVYLWHLPLLQQHGAVAHANRCLKRLMFLAVDAQLLNKNDGPLEPIRTLADVWLRQDQTRTSKGAETAYQASRDATKAPAGDPTPDDWLVPALHKAEECLGVLDREEYPFFGAERKSGEETSSALPDKDALYM